MRKKFEKNKGITLIALVVTIIVLLLLAGISIMMLAGENGILKHATSAKVKSKSAKIEERIKLAISEVYVSEKGMVDYQGLVEALNKAFGEENYSITFGEENDNYWIVKIEDKNFRVTNIGDINLLITEASLIAVSKKTYYKDETCENSINKVVVIPSGFKVKEGCTAIDDGLVVVGPDESEFVWIPVDDINSMYGINVDGKKLGKIYEFVDANVTNNIPCNWQEINGVMSWNEVVGENAYREPDILSSYNTLGNGEEYNDEIKLTSSELEKEFENMIKYVEAEGGFYVGRYEIGCNSDTEKAQSKVGIPAKNSETSMQTWWGLYNLAKTYTEVADDNVGSGMIWGCQWDQMMIWMQKNGINGSI